MRIQRLDICGFKSFMDRTVFSFGDGVTGIVGPNGCGKSNVVDAIRWVMGEQSAKHLRGRSMEDVIFSGSEKHAPLGMSEVSITFRNDSGLVPPQYRGLDEITVTRRLFRNGDSEYLINKAPCRLLDIVELFLGTGVGTKAYSIIEQGRIGLIVSAKPEDRRSLIEEAAGITKYKARRRAAERKLEHTEQNLLRVGDILGELGERLGSLERQAKKAEKYRRVKAEMRGIELHLAALRWLELRALQLACSTRRTAVEEEQRTLGAQLENADADVASQREALGTQARVLEEQAAHVAALEKGAALNQTNLEFYGREREQLDARLAELAGELRELSSRLAALDAEADAARVESGTLAGAGSEERERLCALSGDADAARAAEQDCLSRLELARGAAMAILSEAAARKGDLITLDRRRADLVDRRAKVVDEAHAHETDAGRLERERTRLAREAGEKRQLRLELEARRGDAEEAAGRVRQEQVEAEAELIALREELSDKRSRLQSLEEIQRSYEGHDRGVRAVMTLAAASRTAPPAGEEGATPGVGVPLPEGEPTPGVLGLVSEVLSVPAAHERAIEAVLGERLQGIVVESQAVAADLIRYLADAREGRGTFFPVSLRPREALPPLPHPAFVARAVDVVTPSGSLSPEAGRALVEALLADVAVVQDLEGALQLWAQGVPHTLVTLGGEVVSPAGALAGGDADGPGAGLLQKRREMAELSELVRSLETRVQLAAERHRRLARRAEELGAQLQELQRSGHAEEVQLVHAEKDLGRHAEELARVRARCDELARELEDQDGQLALLDVEAEDARGAAARAETERARREEQIAELSAELSAIRGRAARADAEATELKIRAAADAERREGIERRLQLIAADRQQVAERQARDGAQLAEGRERAGELEAKLLEAKGSVGSLAQELDRAAGELARAREAHAARDAQVGLREQEVRGLRRRLEEVAAAVTKDTLEDRELSLALEHLVAQIRERHNVALTDHVSAYHLGAPPPPGSDQRLQQLREQVERMGEVNLTAVDEHAQLKERFDFLSAQKADLERSIVSLRQAIAKINRTSKERFEETFRIVDEKFQQVFPRLFNGGKAHLVLAAPEGGAEGSDPGVDILAQPPGKKLQSVNLMSGGEKALTAVSMIFAIFLIKPTPFCLLDEVDAPLDDANVGRYNDIVREMSKASQFILITHNKNTMEIADTLYGVTMEEPGVSKTVSVRLSRDEAPAPARAAGAA